MLLRIVHFTVDCWFSDISFHKAVKLPSYTLLSLFVFSHKYVCIFMKGESNFTESEIFIMMLILLLSDHPSYHVRFLTAAVFNICSVAEVMTY
jgi:hypothetical protein